MSKININLPEFDAKQLPLFKLITRGNIEKAINDEIEEVIEHFHVNGWDLDFNGLKEDLLIRLLDFDIGLALLQKLSSNETFKVEADNGIKVRSASGYKPVYYDANTDEIIVSDRGLSESGLVQEDGYFYLGGL
jgi:hypothetical protein